MKELKCLGGFRNERGDYDWNGHKIELDKTMFPHGTVFEIEVETVSPEADACASSQPLQVLQLFRSSPTLDTPQAVSVDKKDLNDPHPAFLCFSG